MLTQLATMLALQDDIAFKRHETTSGIASGGLRDSLRHLLRVRPLANARGSVCTLACRAFPALNHDREGVDEAPTSNT